MMDVILLAHRPFTRAARALSLPGDSPIPGARRAAMLPTPLAVDLEPEAARALAAQIEAEGGRAALVPSLGAFWPVAPGPERMIRSPLLAALTPERYRAQARAALLPAPPPWSAPTTSPSLSDLREWLYTAANDPSWWRRRRAWRATLDALLGWPEASRQVAMDYALSHAPDLPPSLRTPLPGLEPVGTLRAMCCAGVGPDPDALRHLESLDMAHAPEPPRPDALVRLLLETAPLPASLGLAGMLLPDRALEQLGPELGKVRHLDLRGNRLQRLDALAHVQGLQWLDLASNPLRPESLARWLTDHAPHDLRHLDLSRIPMTEAALDGLMATRAPLQRLRMVQTGLREDDLERLLGGHLNHLTTLELGFDPALAAMVMARAPGSQRLRRLSWVGCQLEVGHAGALLGGMAPGLRRLDLAHNPLGDTGLAMLLGSPAVGLLRHLGLSDTGLGPMAGAVLARAAPEALEVLHVEHSRLGTEGAAALATSERLGALKALGAGCASLGDQGAALLVAAPWMAHLEDLALWHNDLGPRGAAALARSPHLRRLRELHLGGNPIGPEGLRALMEAPWLHGLEALHLGGCALEDAGVAALLKAAPPSLLFLDLSFNDLGPATADALAACPWLDHLCALDLRGNPRLEPHALTTITACGAARPWQLV